MYGLSMIVYRRGHIIDRCNSKGICGVVNNIPINSNESFKISAIKAPIYKHFIAQAQRKTMPIKVKGNDHCIYYDYKIMQSNKRLYYNR